MTELYFVQFVDDVYIDVPLFILNQHFFSESEALNWVKLITEQYIKNDKRFKRERLSVQDKSLLKELLIKKS